MSVPTLLCPNCGTVWTPGVKLCPHCGFTRFPAPDWPPPPLGQIPPSKQTDIRLLTGNNAGDILLGLGISFAPFLLMLGLSSAFGLHFFYVLSLAVPPVLYFVLRPRYPVLARGLGYGVLIGLVLTPILLVVGLVLMVLGVLTYCNTNHL